MSKFEGEFGGAALQTLTERIQDPDGDDYVDEVSRNKLVALVVAWRNNHKPVESSAIYQSDRMTIAAPELVISLLDVIGYYEYKEDE